MGNEEKKGFWAEFKEFALQGSIVDVAIGMIIGAAFSAIITSLVEDIIMPLLGIIIGRVDFATLSVTVGDAKVMYGAFIQSCFSFILIALTIFCCIKAANTARKAIERKKEEEAEEEAEEVSEDIQLLSEIRDLLKKND
ncbi:MAG: large conductance mechanosensitive channel protein MscL [Bacillota bacterium]|jgi:large conductance mechanosensitive channel